MSEPLIGSQTTAIAAEKIAAMDFVIITNDGKCRLHTRADIINNEITHPNGVAMNGGNKGDEILVMTSGAIKIG